ncbi:hypothetical protein JXQ70_11945 [bacterium]|nr:hypothetical protein [bacterium]
MSRKYWLLILKISYFIGMTILAFAMRLLPTYQAVHSYGEFITDPDALYHLVRIQQTLEHYPFVPVTTKYEEYPQGSDYESPPLYPLLLATPLKIISLFKPLSDLSMRRILAFWGPVSGILALWAFYLFSGHFLRDTWPRMVGFGLYALLPIAINYTSYGNIDYHGFIIATTLILYYSLLRGSVPLAVMAFVLLIGTWQAGLYQPFIMGISFFVYGFFSKDMSPFNTLRRMFFGSAPILTIMVLYTNLLGVWLLSPGFFGWGTLLLDLWLGFSCLAFERKRLLWAGLGLLFLLPVIPVVIQGFLVLYFNPVPWLQSVQESTPLLFLYREFTLEPLIYLLTPLAILAPFICVYLVFRWRSEITPERVFLIVAYLCHGSAAMTMARYSNQWAPFVVVIIVLGWWLLPKGKALAFFLLLANLFPLYGAVTPKPIRADRKVLHSSLGFWQATPRTQGWAEPALEPEYGVLTDWEYAPMVEYYARRPVIIDARGPMSTDWKWVAELYLSDDELHAYALARNHKQRYIMVRDFYATLNIFPFWIDKTLDYYFDYDGAQAFPKPTMIKTIGFSLCELLSAPYEERGVYVPALNHFRLVWLSQEQTSEGGHRFPWWFKIYEIVPGCRIQLPEEGILEAELVLPNGHKIPYQLKSNHEKQLIVPYPSISLENQLVRCGQKTYQIIITEHMVRNGNTIQVQ